MPITCQLTHQLADKCSYDDWYAICYKYPKHSKYKYGRLYRVGAYERGAHAPLHPNLPREWISSSPFIHSTHSLVCTTIVIGEDDKDSTTRNIRLFALFATHVFIINFSVQLSWVANALMCGWAHTIKVSNSTQWA